MFFSSLTSRCALRAEKEINGQFFHKCISWVRWKDIVELIGGGYGSEYGAFGLMKQ
jgi:hypothetical protein